MKVGDTIWLFDHNSHNRIGRTFESLWSPHTVLGETRISWVLDDHVRVPKNLKRYRGTWIYSPCYSADEVRDRCFTYNNRRRVAKKVEDIADADKLREIMRTLGEGE